MHVEYFGVICARELFWRYLCNRRPWLHIREKQSCDCRFSI